MYVTPFSKDVHASLLTISVTGGRVASCLQRGVTRNGTTAGSACTDSSPSPLVLLERENNLFEIRVQMAG